MSERIHSDLPDFGTFIAGALNKKIEESGKSAKQYAEDNKIPYTSIQRYRNGHCTTECTNAVSILGKVTEGTDQFQYLAPHYFPDQAKMWGSVFGEQSYRSNGEIPHNLIEKNSTYYYVYSYAGLTDSLPLEMIAKAWGDEGLRIAQEYIDAGLVELKDECLVRPNKKLTYGNINTLKTIVSYLITDFAIKNLHSKEAGLANFVNNLNQRGLKELRAHYEEASAKTNKIMNDPDNMGNIPVSATIMFGKMRHADEYLKAVEAELKKQDTKVKEDKSDEE